MSIPLGWVMLHQAVFLGSGDAPSGGKGRGKDIVCDSRTQRRDFIESLEEEDLWQVWAALLHAAIQDWIRFLLAPQFFQGIDFVHLVKRVSPPSCLVPDAGLRGKRQWKVYNFIVKISHGSCTYHFCSYFIWQSLGTWLHQLQVLLVGCACH